MPARSSRRVRQDQLAHDLAAAAEYLQLCDGFLRSTTNAPAVRSDLTEYLATHGWPRPAGYATFIDLLSFTAATLQRHHPERLTAPRLSAARPADPTTRRSTTAAPCAGAGPIPNST
jgi:hypothetical protein